MPRNDTKKTLQIGTRVFYPGFGVAAVMGVEERDFGASSQLFFSLKLDRGETVLLPVDKVENAGVRDLVSVTRARKLLKRVVQPPSRAENPSRRQRFAAYKEGLRAGAADNYTGILQRLLFRSQSRTLADDERRLLREARSYFVSEIANVLDMPREEITALVSPS